VYESHCNQQTNDTTSISRERNFRQCRRDYFHKLARFVGGKAVKNGFSQDSSPWEAAK
jgi:hypothetical protein